MRCDIKSRPPDRYKNHFKGRKRICHLSGRTGYEDEMIKVKGMWVMKDWADDESLNNTSRR